MLGKRFLSEMNRYFFELPTHQPHETDIQKAIWVMLTTLMPSAVQARCRRRQWNRTLVPPYRYTAKL